MVWMPRTPLTSLQARLAPIEMPGTLDHETILLVEVGYDILVVRILCFIEAVIMSCGYGSECVIIVDTYP